MKSLLVSVAIVFVSLLVATYLDVGRGLVTPQLFWALGISTGFIAGGFFVYLR